jgi:hypothetical protein
MRSILNTHPGMWVSNILEPANPSTMSGTFKTGYIFASYDDLCRIFTSEPILYPAGSKIQCCFVGIVRDICITMYDWKSDEDFKKRNMWNVGSHGLVKSYQVLDKISKVTDLFIMTER